MKLRVYLSESSDVYYNIATEKYLFDTVKPDEMLVFLWSNDNTVVIGKNQNAFAEVNLGALTAGGGRLSRRFTGGGAVYHDVNNVNFTFTARNDIYDESRQASVILAAIESFGLRGEKKRKKRPYRRRKKVFGKRLSSRRRKRYAPRNSSYFHRYRKDVRMP